MNIELYRTEFELAVKNTHTLGVSVPATTSKLLDEVSMARAFARADAMVNLYGPEGLCGMCAAVHATHQHLIEQESDVNPVLTIGWVSAGNMKIWETNLVDIKEEIARNLILRTTSPFALHVWLTVSDGAEFQILDFVLPCYLYDKGYDIRPPFLWAMDSRKPTGGNVDFHPIAVGREVLEAVNYLDKDWSPTNR